MIELFFKIRGGNAPPALPVADPMIQTVMELRGFGLGVPN